MRNERGFALVITLIVTALLVALLVEFVSEVYVDTSHSHNFVASQQAGILAESGIAGGIMLLKASELRRKGAGYSSLQEQWAKPFQYDAGEGTVSIAIEEESGKLDLNAIVTTNGTVRDFHQHVLERLLKNLKLPPELSEALMDWMDPGDAPRPNGAESSYYQTLRQPYQAHNAHFDTFEELALVKGFTPEVIAKLRPYLTVYGTINDVPAQININTARPELVAALDEKMMSGDLVDRVLEQRKKQPVTNLAQIEGLDTLAIALQLKVNCKGSIYRIHAEGKVGESVSVAEAVVKVDQGRPTVLYWREY